MTPEEEGVTSERFRSLETAEKLLIWAICIWVRALQSETNAHGVLRACFEQAGAKDAHLALDGMMTIISNSACRQIDIRCPKCPNTSSDEMRIVCAVAAWQNGMDPEMADSFLGPLVLPAGLPLLRKPVVILAGALLGAEMIVRPTQRPSKFVSYIRPIETDEHGESVTIH